MKRKGFNTQLEPVKKKYLMLPLPVFLPKVLKIGAIVGLVLASNIISLRLFGPKTMERNLDVVPSSVYESVAIPKTGSLYLLDKAAAKVSDVQMFAQKVEDISYSLKIPPEWLMSVMYAESKFDASVMNYKGSKAVGLIQFMPSTATSLNVSTERLRRMDPLQQLEYVYLYLQQVRERYGDYQSLTDLYLAILYPRARNQDECYTLYAKPERAYVQNSGLDENKDGRVTVSDIDRHLQRKYTPAYALGKDS